MTQRKIKFTGQGRNAILGACLFLGTDDPVARNHFLQKQVENGSLQIQRTEA